MVGDDEQGGMAGSGGSDSGDGPSETAWLLAMDRAAREAARAASGPRAFTATLADALAGVEPNAFVWLGSVDPAGVDPTGGDPAADDPADAGPSDGDRSATDPTATRVRIRGASGAVETPATIEGGTVEPPGPTARAARDGEVIVEDASADREYGRLRETAGIPAAGVSVSVPFAFAPAAGAPAGVTAGDEPAEEGRDTDGAGDPADAGAAETGVVHLYTDVEGDRRAVREAAAVLGGTVADSYRSLAAMADRRRERQRLETVRSTLSHDVGNALNLAAGRLELAADGAEGSHLPHVDRALERIEALVDGCQSFVRAGEPVDGWERRSVGGLAEQCWEQLPTGESTLETEEVTVAGEPARVGLLLTELIENALVHSDGPVTVTVEALDAGRGFAVADTGNGIPDDERGLVFDRGYTTDPDRKGHGLTVAREAARAHGWRVGLAETTAGTRVEVVTDRW